MRIARLCLVALFAAAAATAQEMPQAQVVEIGDNECVVHVVGAPFDHTYYEPRLETLLLERYACRGLVFRRVVADRTLAELAQELDARVMVHRPTLVVIQAGNGELHAQRRRVTFDFSVYAAPVEAIVGKLRAANVKVVLCSVIPQGTDGPKGRLNPPNDGLKTWVDQARDIAGKHGAVFVDLFTAAIDWDMINNPRTYYDSGGHRKSWDLFAQQVRFVPETDDTVGIRPALAPGVKQTREFKEEIERGHAIVAELAGIQGYALPGWVTVADFERQRQAALDAVEASVKTHDEAMRRMVAPKPLSVRIAPVP